MKKLNLADVSPEDYRSPAGQYHMRCQEISRMMGARDEAGGGLRRHPFEIELVSLGSFGAVYLVTLSSGPHPVNATTINVAPSLTRIDERNGYRIGIQLTRGGFGRGDGAELRRDSIDRPYLYGKRSRREVKDDRYNVARRSLDSAERELHKRWEYSSRRRPTFTFRLGTAEPQCGPPP